MEKKLSMAKMIAEIFGIDALRQGVDNEFPNKKTGKEYFDLIPDREIADLWKKRAEQYNSHEEVVDIMSMEYPFFSLFFLKAFPFHETEEEDLWWGITKDGFPTAKS